MRSCASTWKTTSLSIGTLSYLSPVLVLSYAFLFDDSREQLRSNLLVPEYSLSVDMRHLQSVDAELAHEITQKPEYLVLFENAARRLAKQIHFQEDQSLDTVPDIQILLKSAANPLPMRQITSDHISKLVRLSGIVSSAAAPSAKATRLHLYCRVCRHVKIIPVNKGFSGVQIPRSCEKWVSIGFH